MTHAAALFASALTIDGDGDVCRMDADRARAAVTACKQQGGSIRDLLKPYRWAYKPGLALSLAFDGADLDRQLRGHAVWCARQGSTSNKVARRPRPTTAEQKERLIRIVTTKLEKAGAGAE